MARFSARLQAKQQAVTEPGASDALDANGGQHSSATGSNRKRMYQESSDEEYDQEHDGKRVRTSRSRRKRATQKKTKRSTDAQTDQQGSNVEESSKPARKLPADERFRKVRGKLGFLDKLVTDVPIEVIFEVFSYLQPIDILHLSRTSKELRNILMNKSSESIWRAARANVEGLPPLPQDLNEPQYAHLMFFPHCHFCMHTSRCEIVSWEYRVRCCKKCEHDVFGDAHDLVNEDWNSFYEICDLLPSYHIHPHTRRRWRRIQVFRLSIVQQYVLEYKTTRGDPEERERWLEKRRRSHKDLMAHVILCEQWHQARLSNRAAELDAARTSRRNEILERLQAIGWADEARMMLDVRYNLNEFSTHKSVNQPTKLTDRAWTTIEQDLVGILQRHKTQRLDRQKKLALRSRYELLKTMYTKFCEEGDHLPTALPGFADIIACGLFDRIIWTTPFDQEVTENDFVPIFSESLPSEIERWKVTKEDELVAILQQTVPNASKSNLLLATCVFKCGEHDYCVESLWYPRMFEHHHREGLWRVATGSDYVDLSAFNPFEHFYCRPWSTQKLKNSVDVSQAISQLVTSCGLDPATATLDDLAAADPLFECGTCQHYTGGRYFYRWYSVPRHINHQLSINEFGEHKEQILEASRSISTWTYVRCRKCYRQQRLPELRGHYSSKHGIDTEITRDHWFWDPASGSGFRFEEPTPAIAPVLEASSST